MTKDNIQELLQMLEFEHEGNVYTKRYENVSEPLKVDISGDGHNLIVLDKAIFQLLAVLELESIRPFVDDPVVFLEFFQHFISAHTFCNHNILFFKHLTHLSAWFHLKAVTR